MTQARAKRRLIRLLQKAYSGELAAALAYEGHWRSVDDEDERFRIRQIANDEWLHRRRVHALLRRLGARPAPVLDGSRRGMGAAIGALCHWSGWLAPMVVAWLIEVKNVREYERAAWLARRAGLPDLVDELLHMADVEVAHERYFRSKAMGPAPVPAAAV